MPAPSQRPSGRPGAAAGAPVDLLARLGDRLQRASAEHKSDETKTRATGELPGGISGIAQLSACKFDVHKDGDNAGKAYFYAAAIIQEPETFTDRHGNKFRVKGKRTQINCPLYDTPNKTRQTFEEHLAWLYNELRKLGVNTKAFPNPLPRGYLEGVAAALVKAAPYFEFETSELPQREEDKKAGRPPMVYHSWNGTCEYNPDIDPGAGVMETAPSSNGVVHQSEAAAVAEESSAEEAATEEINPDDIDRSDAGSLVDRANGSGDDAERAQKQLMAMASAAGYDDDTIRAAKTWQEVADMASSPQSTEESAGSEESGGEESSEEDEVTEEEAAPPPPPPPPAPKTPEPVKGKTAKFRPLDPADKTKKNRVKKAIECEIVSVDKATKTVTLKSLVDGKTLYKGVKWDILNK